MMLPVIHEIDGNRPLVRAGTTSPPSPQEYGCGLIPRQHCVALRLVKDSKADQAAA